MLGTSKSIWGFEPRSIPNCQVWLDASDQATMNSTTTVTTWNDKSGNSNNVKGTATLSGSNMTFNGSTQAFSNTTYVFPHAAYSMFAVYSNTTAPGSGAYMNAVYGGGGFPMMGVYESRAVSARSVVANTGALTIPGVGWATRIASTGTDMGNMIAVDSSGNVFVIGGFAGSQATIYGVDGTNKTLSSFGSGDCFLVKYSADGSIVWAAQIAGTGNDVGYGIAIDPSGNLIVCGIYGATLNFYNSNGTNATNLSYTGGACGFIAKYTGAGFVTWVAQMTQPVAGLSVNGIALDTSGNISLSGTYCGNLTIYGTDSGNTTLSPAATSGYDTFVIRYNSSGAVSWASKVVGDQVTDQVMSYGCAVDPSGNTTVIGNTTGTARMYNKNMLSSKTLTAANDAFIAQYTSSGEISWITRVASAGAERGSGITTDSSGNIFVTGGYQSRVNFYNQDVTVGTFLESIGGNDSFVAKYSSTGYVSWAVQIGGSQWDSGLGIKVDISGNVIVSGYYLSPLVTFYSTTSGITKTIGAPVGSYDSYIAKYSSTGVIVWALQIGSLSNDEYANKIATDTSGNIFIIGDGGGPTLTLYNSDGSTGATLSNSGGTDCFIAKYTSDGFINAIPTSANTLVSATYTPSTFSPFVNGYTATTLSGTTLATTGLFLGGPSNYFNGSISEVLIYGSNLTSSQRQLIEGYLSKKWGITVLGSHPFYIYRPMNRRFLPTDIPGNSLWLDASDQSSITSSPGGVTTLAGGGSQGFADGTGTAAIFNRPTGVAVLPDGNIVVADQLTNRIRVVTYPGGAVTTLAGSGAAAYADGGGVSASFFYPAGVSVLADGNIVVADNINHRIRVVTYPGGVVTTLAGNGSPAFADGTGTGASFRNPNGVAVLANGQIIVTDSGNHRIRVVTYPGGVVTTLAGSGNETFADGTGTAASFSSPSGVAILKDGNIVVTDFMNNRIRVVSYPSGLVVTLAGGSPGFADGTGSAAKFYLPTGVAVVSTDTIVVADYSNNRIRVVTYPAGAVTTLAGNGGSPAFADGVGEAASFKNPWGLGVFQNSNIVVADYANNRIRLITPATIWSDKSGNGKTMTGTATLVGSNMVFDGVTQTLSNTTSNFTSSDYSMFAVYSNTTSPPITQYANVVYGGGGFPMLGSYSDPVTTEQVGATTGLRAIASSSNGSNIATAVYGGTGGYIYTGALSQGVWTWTTQTGADAGSSDWYFIASSASGSNLVACTATAGYVRTGAFNGFTWTWTQQTGGGTRSWRSVASSASGSNIFAGAATGNIWTAAFNGSTWTWTELTGSGSGSWTGLTSSASGSIIAATNSDTGTPIRIGRYNGITWSWESHIADSSTWWEAVALSASGLNICAGQGNGYVWSAVFDGTSWTWTAHTNLSYAWRGIASSASGSNIVASGNGGVYMGSFNGSTWSWSSGILISGGSLAGAKAASDYTGSRLAVVGLSSSNAYTIVGNANISARSVVANTGSLVVPVGWAARVASTGSDQANSVAADPLGNVFVGGYYRAAVTLYNADGTSGATLALTGVVPGFIVKYTPTGVISWAARLTSASEVVVQSITTDSSGNAFVGGYYAGGTATLSNADGSSGATLVLVGGADTFVAKYTSAGVVSWAARAVGSGNDFIAGIASDPSGNVCVTGRYASTFTLYGVGDATNKVLAFAGGTNDCFIAKYSSGGAISWAFQIASTTGDDQGRAIATDPSGNVFVAGSYSGILNLNGADTTIKTLSNASATNDCFIARYTSNGAISWAAQIASTSSDFGYGIATDSSGNVFVTGYYGSSVTLYNADGSSGSTLAFTGGSSDCFIAKYTLTGVVSWATRIAGTGADQGNGIATDSSGNVLVTGNYDAALTLYNANGSPGATLVATGTMSCFVAKYTSAGAVLWGTRIVAPGSVTPLGIATDLLGNVLVSGHHNSTPTVHNRDGTTGQTLPTTVGFTDGFIVKYTSDGFINRASASSNVLVSATYTPSTLSPFVNGYTATTRSGTTSATTGLFLGGPSNYFNGSISEVLMYNTNLTTGQRQQVEGYLRQKWGLAPQIVSGHQYKLIPPATPAPIVATSAGSCVLSLNQSVTGGTITWGSSATLVEGYVWYVGTGPQTGVIVSGVITSSTTYTVNFTSTLVQGVYYAWVTSYNAGGMGATTVSSGVPVLSSLYTFTSSTFTTAGATGKNGPTLAQCTTAYASFGSWVSNTSYFNMTTQGYQLWTVPQTRSYTIRCAGGGIVTTGATPACGAIVQVTLSLTQGQILQLLVGQRGSVGTGGTGDTSGGGGSFVASGTTPATGTCLVAAGGAGGANTVAQAGYSWQSGQSTTSGSAGSVGGTVGYGGAGGTNGGGGGIGDYSVEAAGGGFVGNGQYGGGWGTTPNGGGISFQNGGTGGSSPYNADGGFGGGGATYGLGAAGGGGGGYSGGGTSSGNGPYACGGGGSFYPGGTFIGATNNGQGYITIT